MAILRHESQQYPNPAALTAETIVPTANDEVHIESLNRRFNWLEGSSTSADNLYVIEQTSESANGRWAATAVEGAKVFTGSASTGAIPNGNTAVFTVSLTGSGTLLADSGAALGITNGGAFPTNVFLDSLVLTADNTVQVTVVNESGVDVPAFTVEVKAIDYTGVATAGTPYLRNMLIVDLVKTGNPTYVSSPTFSVGRTYIAAVGSGDDLTNVGYVADNVPFIATAETPTSYNTGISAAYDITDATQSLTELRDDFGVTLTSAYETDAAADIKVVVTLSQPILGQNDVLWGACGFSAVKLSSTKLALYSSDRFFVEQVI
ncbi:hypothetical protein GCM10009007_03270 [Formosimonas limnophila]|uniref:Uncharacterized protein n=1 Tax=Formosimonas limnophila TaxID=1384487 RepID=A0A8J3CLD4_9BURK|nr:hypothetical protein [Formosimonas limnophila]GHA66161.1 hypothetical protein GCM10009007_03270 [Formosimonas limnophila]